MSKTLYNNANILTARGIFCRGQLLTAGERISCVTNGEASMTEDQEAGAVTHDLAGAYVVPGFVDTHFHLTSLALQAVRCDLAPCDSAESVRDILAHYARDEAGAFVMGVQWDENHWRDATPLTRDILDSVDAERPVLARRICGHVGVVNSVLLARLDSEHSALIEAETGVVREHALWQANRMCDPGAERIADGFDNAIARLHALGVTAIHDLVEASRCDAYVEGLRRASKPLRIDALIHVAPSELSLYRGKFAPLKSRGARVAGIKCFLDGSIGGGTAALNRHYQGEEGTGRLLLSDDALRELAKSSVEAGHVCAMHAIGDRAVDQALRVLETVPHEPSLFRIEHCELVGPEQVQRLSDVPLVLSQQPNFVRQWGMPGGMYERRLGTHRYLMMNGFRTLIDAGVEIVFGSDGMPPGPLYGMKGAVAHHVHSERISAREALDRYTRRPNTLPAHERNAGILESGRLADFVVLDSNPFETDLDRCRVLRTVIGGAIVHRAPDAEAA
jgi:predicted amidohydrolase YtcJ